MATFITEPFIRRLSIVQRDVLLKHVEWPQQVDTGNAYQTTLRLIELKLVSPDTQHKPSITTITDAGREAAAILLGQAADALVAAGCLDPELRPLDILRMIRQARERDVLLVGLSARKQRKGRRPADLAAKMAGPGGDSGL